MATVRFAAEVDVHAPIEIVWETATHWPSHSRWVPLTKVTVLEDAGGLGTRFVGRTALGPFGFDYLGRPGEGQPHQIECALRLIVAAVTIDSFQ